ncbi:DUF397 domain-containing protein [Streptomyces millisiae]|uniref:DUF397 domain-containing protein n=1 Tax=Streptomyces millisiae TaxID=3075542 RepID=A0ABU2LME3_9ACTN|nr:DUF397 domain-containing protein [Streptomyces sp. DSM 44918]MDT0318423.1 DUF397 domain-containing protein [Streptomyces sp. DSM 44918]
MISRDGIGPWRRSSYSGGNGNCVEVAQLTHDGQVVRDSKNPSGPTLRFDDTGWAAFLASTGRGEFDN